MPPNGRKVQLEPNGETQFKYLGGIPNGYKYGSRLGVILKREYPGLVKYMDNSGVTRSRPALEWEDYYLVHDDEGVSNADRVKQEFWRCFEVAEANRVEADRILESYARRKVKDILYQARVDAVKIYYDDQGEELDDKLACARELTLEQYLASRVDWFSPTVWPHICSYWCSKEFKEARRRAQKSRLQSEDVAQNRGGSRPFTECRQFLEHKFGPEKATIMNTYAVMKSGMKNLDENGNSGAISSQKAQKRLDDYSTGMKEAYPENWQDIDLDERVLYNTSGGMPHGRVAIASGAVKKAAVLSAARATNLKPSISIAYQNAIQENEQLRRANESLKRKTEMHDQLFKMVFAKMGEDLPEWFLLGRSNAHTQVNTDSSHVSSDDGPIDHDVVHGNIEGDNDEGNIGVNDNNCGFNLDDASRGGSH